MHRTTLLSVAVTALLLAGPANAQDAPPAMTPEMQAMM